MRLVILTSGGDAPGMNACIRAVVRAALPRGWEVMGARFGYGGLVRDELLPMGHNSVSNIIQRGGTILGAGRCPELQTPEGLRAAADTLNRHSIEAVVAIGGDGTFRGLRDLCATWGGRGVGIPGTVDNDATGSDFTIGFDTAVNTALEAIDRIRDTAEAYERCFIVEVMGRASGAIAIAAALAGGAEEVCVPETHTNEEAIARRIVEGKQAGRASSIIVAAEGDETGGAEALATRLEAISGVEFRVCVLGHIQRGGSPTARDRILASRLGAYAVELLGRGEGNVIVGERANVLTTTPLSQIGAATAADVRDFGLVSLLSR
jgi:6-phosphofructokinase 1